MREREMKSCNNLRKTFPRKKRVISFDKTIVPHEQRGVHRCVIVCLQSNQFK